MTKAEINVIYNSYIILTAKSSLQRQMKKINKKIADFNFWSKTRNDERKYDYEIRTQFKKMLQRFDESEQRVKTTKNK